MLEFLKRNFYLLLALAALFSIFFGFTSRWDFRDPETALNKNEKIKLRTNHYFIQNFKANKNNLSRVEFLLGTADINKEDRVVARLADEKCSETIREGALEPSFLSSSNLYDFKFEKIPDSKDKEYCLTIAFESQRAKAKSLQIFVENIDPAQNQSPLIDSTDGTRFVNQTLSMRLSYANASWRQSIEELNKRISQYKPWFLKHYFLYAIVFGFIALSIAIVVILVAL